MHSKHCSKKWMDVYAVQWVMIDQKIFGKIWTFRSFGNQYNSDNLCVSIMCRMKANIWWLDLLMEISIELPFVIECEQIPNARDEIPMEIVLHYKHLHYIADYIPPIDNQPEIMMLIERDITIANHVLDQKVRPCNLPYVQKLYHGWTIIGGNVSRESSSTQCNQHNKNLYSTKWSSVSDAVIIIFTSKRAVLKWLMWLRLKLN